MSAGRFLSYGRQRVDDEDVAAVVEVLRGDYLTQGPAVERFEQALCDVVGARHAVAVSSGTAALHVACLAAGLGPGRRGVTSALTFVASANAMIYAGADAELVDIDPVGLGMSPTLLSQALERTPDVDVVMPVLFAGLACDAKQIRAASGSRVVIEDASHALGGTYEDSSAIGAGVYADMSVFSFHPVKSVTTAEGGAVTTNDDELARRLRLLRNHGIEREPDRHTSAEPGARQPWYYEQQLLGYNYRLSDIQAALGISQLAKLDDYIQRRRDIACAYDEALLGMEHVRPHQSTPANRQRSAHHLYVVDLDLAALGISRSDVMHRLRRDGIGSQVHYVPVHRQPYHRERYGWKEADFPQVERYYGSCLSLPIHPGLSEGEVARVVAALAALPSA